MTTKSTLQEILKRTRWVESKNQGAAKTNDFCKKISQGVHEIKGGKI